MNKNTPSRVASSKSTISLPPGTTAIITSPAQTKQPIQSVYPLLKSTLISFIVPTLLGLYRVLIHLTSQLVKPILVLSPIPIILYILSPLFTFCQVLFDVLVLTPVRTAAYILDAIYPVYVFVGVACITGGLLGLMARIFSEWLVSFISENHKEKKAVTRDA